MLLFVFEYAEFHRVVEFNTSRRVGKLNISCTTTLMTDKCKFLKLYFINYDRFPFRCAGAVVIKKNLRTRSAASHHVVEEINIIIDYA